MPRHFRACLVILIAALSSPAFARPEAPAPIQSNDAQSFTPKVLSSSDAALYREIFALQEDGAWKAADTKIRQVSDDVLMGYVQYQRYMHPTKYRSSYTELRRWMSAYADHPEAAKKVYRLARKRRPSKASPPVRPSPRQWRTEEGWDLHPDLQADYRKKGKGRVKRIEGRVRYLARKEQALKALAELDQHLRRSRITTRQYDRMKSWVAASLYYQGYVGKAGDLARSAAKRNGDTALLSHWISGMIDFRNGRHDAALSHFDQMAANQYQDDSLRAAAGFWAARSAIASGAIDRVATNLEIAASKPMTFYGQLALAQLGRDHAFDWRAATIAEADYAQMAKDHRAIKRAVALAEVGKTAEADLELRWLNGSIEDEEASALLGLAAALDLPSAQLDIAAATNGKGKEAGLYPIPAFVPEGGFETDRAVLYALMRQESKFKPDAKSRVGARGLMQLMPRTASYIAKDRSLASRRGRDRLFDPETNLRIGQAYVNYLVASADEASLFDVAAAYNGGPGNLRRWKNKLNEDDPLLFIESIPNSESRDFVEKVLTNIWVYRARLGQPAPSRNLVAAGKLPAYEALDRLLDEE